MNRYDLECGLFSLACFFLILMLIAGCGHKKDSKPHPAIPMACVSKMVPTGKPRCEAISGSLAHCYGEFDVTYSCVRYKVDGK